MLTFRLHHICAECTLAGVSSRRGERGLLAALSTRRAEPHRNTVGFSTVIVVCSLATPFDLCRCVPIKFASASTQCVSVCVARSDSCSPISCAPSLQSQLSTKLRRHLAVSALFTRILFLPPSELCEPPHGSTSDGVSRSRPNHQPTPSRSEPFGRRRSSREGRPSGNCKYATISA